MKFEFISFLLQFGFDDDDNDDVDYSIASIKIWC